MTRGTVRLTPSSSYKLAFCVTLTVAVSVYDGLKLIIITSYVANGNYGLTVQPNSDFTAIYPPPGSVPSTVFHY